MVPKNTRGSSDVVMPEVPRTTQLKRLSCCYNNTHVVEPGCFNPILVKYQELLMSQLGQKKKVF